ncbi:hypothetical protein, partial [Burkholderia cenocepacia]|uniref:hypothetical protein n=1 Tax=Burkholderia cenocepacia TaxID=95486 RepID=UPI001C88FCC7
FTQIDSSGLPCNYSTRLEHGNPDTPAIDRCRRNARFRQASQRNAVIPCRQAALEIVRLVDILRKYPTETPQRASTLAPP